MPIRRSPSRWAPVDEVEADLAMRHVKTVEVAGHVVASDGRPTIQAYVALYVPDAGNWGNELSTSTGAAPETRGWQRQY